MTKLTYISADDWCGLYVDDTLWAEGHSIEWPWELTKLFAAQTNYEFDDHSHQAYKCIEELGRCPQNLTEVYYDE